MNSVLRARALELIEARGFEATTAEDISQAAGISRRTFFRYFPIREDVLFSDHAAYLLAVEQRLTTRHDEPILVAGHALEAVIDGYLLDADFVRRRSAVVRPVSALRDREVLWFREYQTLLASYLSADERGTRGAIFAQIVAAALLAALNQVLERYLETPDGEDPKALFAELLDDIADSMADTGLRGRGPGPEHPERTGVVVINSTLSADEIADLIDKAER
ncbi:TetR family transcriptional regulator [Subtercola lobariae]|uniref:TetR family transcriptional regulator n=2 Tax=Subtercola lobariae TaxID=1588641 RepID=A0A917EYP5_9MICO|nr:TetR family transcriptional regulator [Subtercola lobariae]